MNALRLHILVAVSFVSLVSSLHAAVNTAKDQPYIVSVDTTQVKDPAGKPSGQTLVKLLVMKTPGDANSKWEVLSRPILIIADGQRAQVEVGGPSHEAKPATGHPSGTETWSGVRVDLIRPMKPAQVVAITTIWEDGAIVWAHSDTVDVGGHTPLNPAVLERLKADSLRPAQTTRPGQ
jgi:hypothetical protein